jgi:hypothetical protein
VIKLKGKAAGSGREIVFELAQIHSVRTDSLYGELVCIDEQRGGYNTEILGNSITVDGLNIAPDVALREALAEYAHDAWAGWMRYMFSQCTNQADGSLIIPPALVGRWTRQMCQSYVQLPESETLSDLAEADKILEVMSDGKATDQA